MSKRLRIRIGTRASALARWQAEWVAGRLKEVGVQVELVLISTAGDREQQGPIEEMGGRGVFTKEIQRALLDGRVDLAVHSLKDLPTENVEGLCLAAVPRRAPAGDVLVCRRAESLDRLESGCVVGTGSFRRRSQLLHARPDLKTKDIRGNVETRVRKLEQGQYDALILAEAGLRRLGLAAHITQILPPSMILPAVGQGALGLEARCDDDRTRSALQRLDHLPTHAAVRAERTMLHTLEGGCLAPIAAWGRTEEPSLVLTGRVLSPDGTKMIETTESGPVDAAESLGRSVAGSLIAQGAGELIRAARRGG